MKKVILSAFCLSLGFVSANVFAGNVSQSVITIASESDERKPIKPEELPESVKKTLATDAYKGWTVKEAALINTPKEATSPTTDQARVAVPYYEVTLTNEKDNKVVKFQKDGTPLN